MIGGGLLNGAGDTRFPMIQSPFVLWGLSLPHTWSIVVHRGGDAHVAWLGGAVLYLLQAPGLWWREGSGKWKRVRIVAAREAGSGISA